MNYQKIYDSIIQLAKSRANTKKEALNILGGYTELHHIKPKSLFPELSKQKSNLVYLSAREHIICHMLLIKIYNSPSMVFALSRMLSKNKYQSERITNSRQYEFFRKYHNKLVKGKTWEELYGTETAEKMREVQKNKTFNQNQKTKQLLSEQRKGKSWEEYYGIETAEKMREQRKKYKGISNIERFGEEKAKKIKENRSGKNHPLFGKPSWNKGVSPSEETKQKFKETRKKLHYSKNNYIIYDANGIRYDVIDIGLKQFCREVLNIEQPSVFKRLLKGEVLKKGKWVGWKIERVNRDRKN